MAELPPPTPRTVAAELAKKMLDDAMRALPCGDPMRERRFTVSTNVGACGRCGRAVEVGTPLYVEFLESTRARVRVSCGCGNRWSEWVPVVEDASTR